MKKRKQLIEEILYSFHAFHKATRAKAASLGQQNHITHSQWFVLMLIRHTKKTSIKGLSEMLGMSSSAVTQFVDSLVQNCYVIRQEDPKDRRSAQLKLSPKGRKHIATMKEKRITEIAGLFDALTDSELEEFLRLHKKITSGFLDKKS